MSVLLPARRMRTRARKAVCNLLLQCGCVRTLSRIRRRFRRSCMRSVTAFTVPPLLVNAVTRCIRAARPPSPASYRARVGSRAATGARRTRLRANSGSDQGTRHEMPCNHDLEAYLDAYVSLTSSTPGMSVTPRHMTKAVPGILIRRLRAASAC